MPMCGPPTRPKPFFDCPECGGTGQVTLEQYNEYIRLPTITIVTEEIEDTEGWIMVQDGTVPKGQTIKTNS